MDGSALAFTGLWLIWMAITIATLWLAYPLMRTARERYMTNRTLYGDARLRFEDSGWRLIWAWLPFWVVFVVPNALLFLRFYWVSIFNSFPPIWLMTSAPIGEISFFIILLAIWLIGWLLFLRYRAAETRIFMEARRINDLRLRCQFYMRHLLGPNLAVVGRSFWPGIGVGLLIAIVAGMALVIARLLDGGEVHLLDYFREDLWFDSFKTTGAKVFFLIFLWIDYGLTILFSMWLWTVVYFRRRHGNLCETTTFTGLESLATVRQRTSDDQIESEGFADALDVGGL